LTVVVLPATVAVTAQETVLPLSAATKR
jgi:hypothetical protein